jgi:hypothetical protein
MMKELRRAASDGWDCVHRRRSVPLLNLVLGRCDFRFECIELECGAFPFDAPFR